MTYDLARKALAENLQLIQPTQNPVMWNLSQGLLQLTEALEQDIRTIKRKLADMESTMNSIR
jgi:hypothetical protein